jgi:elongation factor G
MRCFSVIGPSGVGKTALVDHLARLGEGVSRVETRDGMGFVSFRYLGEPWCAIDCPGAIETLPDVRVALLASDAVVIVAPPDPEAAALVAPFLRVAEAAGAPALLFVNRIDEARGRVADIAAALQGYAGHAIVLRQIPIREGDRVVGAVDLISERAWRYREGGPSALVEIPASMADREHEARAELLEHLSEFDDALLEQIIDDREPPADQLYALCAKVLGESRVTPTLIGSALHGAGMTRLMKALRHETPGVAALRARLAGDGPAPLAVAFHVHHRRHVGKETFLRALGEGVAAGAPLGGGNVGVLGDVARADRTTGPVAPGDVVAALKSDQFTVGRLLFADRSAAPPDWARSPAPMLARRLAPASERDDAKLSAALARMAEDDPGLVVAQEEGTGAPLIRVQGPMHLRRVLATLAEEFGVTATEGPPSGQWRETIARAATVHHRHRKQTGGAGQFADVTLTVAPNPRGAGFTFDEAVKGGAVPRNFIPAVEAGARDALSAGPLGCPVIDVAVTLTDGQHHAVDSSDFAFRAAGRAAVTQALAEAAPVLLQPIHEVAIHAPSVHSGALVALVSGLKGRVLGFDRDPQARGWDLFRAQLPGAALEELATALRAATQGLGWFESAFDHDEEVYGRDAERIAAMLKPAPRH